MQQYVYKPVYGKEGGLYIMPLEEKRKKRKEEATHA